MKQGACPANGGRSRRRQRSGRNFEAGPMAVTGTTLAARQYRSREAGLRGRLLPDEFLALERDGRTEAFVETATLEADPT